MEPDYDIHLGLVVSSSPDPEGRNRLQVWIPYLSNTLYEPLNRKLKNVKFKGVEDLDKSVLEILQTTLPWAECAAPVFGGSSGTFNSATGKTAVNSGSTFQSNGNAVPSLPTATLDMNTNAVKPDNANKSYPTANDLGISSAWNKESAYDKQGRLATKGNTLQFISAQELHNINLAAAQSGGLAGLSAPTDSSYFTPGTTTTAEQWANYMDAIALHENVGLGGGKGGGTYSSVNGYIPVNVTYNEGYKNNGPVHWSEGIFQMTVGENGLTSDNIYDPNAQAAAFTQRARDFAVVAGAKNGGWTIGNSGIAAYGWNKAANDVAVANGSNSNDLLNKTSLTQAASLNGAKNVVYTDRSAAVGCVPSNVGLPGSPVGTFSIPNAGSKVWVFFNGGDVQRPVYFAQVPNPGDISALHG